MIPARWWICRCGRKLYEHARHKTPNSGIDEYKCASTKSGRFESSAEGFDYTPDKGLFRVAA